MLYDGNVYYHLFITMIEPCRTQSPRGGIRSRRRIMYGCTAPSSTTVSYEIIMRWQFRGNYKIKRCARLYIWVRGQNAKRSPQTVERIYKKPFKLLTLIHILPATLLSAGVVAGRLLEHLVPGKKNYLSKFFLCRNQQEIDKK